MNEARKLWTPPHKTPGSSFPLQGLVGCDRNRNRSDQNKAPPVMKGCVSREGTRRGGRAEDAAAVPGATPAPLPSATCPGRENPWICKQQGKTSDEAGEENSQWCFLAPWPPTFSSRPHPKHFYVCVPSPDFLFLHAR